MSAVDADIVAAVRKGLADYFTSYLTPLIGTDADVNSPTFGKSLLTVREAWPMPKQKLNQFDITVLATGEADDWAYFPPAKIGIVRAAPPFGLVDYAYGWIDGLQMDLDCFASTPAKRNELARLVRLATNRPPQQTVAALAANQKFLVMDRAPGLVLQLAGFFNSYVEYMFSPVSAPMEDSDAAEVGEWRTHFRGGASLFIRDQQLLTLITRLGLTIRTGKVTHSKYLP